MKIRRYTVQEKILLLISFLNGLVFYAPVALLVRTQVGITVPQFFTLQMILSISIFIFEVPSGYISDRLGYKKSIVFSQGLLLAARLLLLLSKSYWLFAVEAVVEGLSNSLISGSDSAYLYSYYKGEEYTVFNSKIGRAGTIGFILSTIAYSLILHLSNITWLVAATCITTCIAFVLSIMLPKEKCVETDDTPSDLKQMWKHLPQASWRFFFVLSAISVAYLVIDFFYAVKVKRIGLDYESMTLIILGYSSIELLTPTIMKHIKAASYRKIVKFMLVLCAVGFCGIFFMDNLWCIPLMLFVPLILSIMAYLTDELINVDIDKHGLNEKRATVLSIFNMGNNVLEILFLTVSAVLTSDEGNIAFLFVAVYIVLVLGSSLIVAIAHKAKTLLPKK